MTGADHFNEILVRAQHIANGAPEEHRSALMLNFMQGAIIGCSARLLQDNDFGAAYDVITMGSQALAHMGAQFMQEHPEVAEMVPSVFARFHGADVPLGAPELSPPPQGNTLSAAELEALGLDPRLEIRDDPRAPDEGLGDPKRYQFHEKPRASTYEPLHFRCAREGADGIACNGEGAWHVNIAMMKVGPIVRFLCAEHCRREVAWAYPDEEYVMHDEHRDHLAFNRRRKPKRTG